MFGRMADRFNKEVSIEPAAKYEYPESRLLPGKYRYSARIDGLLFFCSLATADWIGRRG
jgi:hypothetical protein